MRVVRSCMNKKRFSISFSLLLVLLLFGAACGNADSTAASVADSASDAVEYAEPAMEEASFDDDVGEALSDEAMSDSAMSDSAMSNSAMSDSAMSDDRLAATQATGSAANETIGQMPDTGREIVYTADLALGTSDVTMTTRDAIRAVELRGGFLFSQDTAGGVNGYSTLVFKVPPDQFQAVLNELGSVGSVRSQSVSAEDVTAVVVDLQSRINTNEASVSRLRNLLDNATAIEVIAELENQLLERETTLEQLRGRLRTVQRQVDFATITVRVTELLNHPAIALELATYASHDGGFECQDHPRVTRVEIDTAFTMCWLVTNVGDTSLVDVRVDDPAFASLPADLLVVEGDTARLEPGETVVLAYEFETSESLRVRSRAEATPVALDGTVGAEPITAVSRNLRLDVSEPTGGLPGFGEVLSSSWNALKVAAIVIALVLVAIAPFLALALPVGWLLLYFVRRRRRTMTTSTSTVTSSPPPPPPPAREEELTSVD